MVQDTLQSTVERKKYKSIFDKHNTRRKIQARTHSLTEKKDCLPLISLISFKIFLAGSRVPSPYVMSFYRRGCVQHQKYIDFFQNVKKRNGSMQVSPNNRISHATRLFDAWASSTTKHVYSKRLGISYDTRYVANIPKNSDSYNDRCMYRKRFDNFNTVHTDTTSLSIRQQKRFERACRSVFADRSRDRISRPARNLDDQLGRARKHRFLFLPSQTIFKPIQHIKYQNNAQRFDRNHYAFPIPRINFADVKPTEPIIDLVSNVPIPDNTDLLLDQVPAIQETIVGTPEDTPEEVVNARFDPLDVSVPVEPISENIAIEDDSENITNDNTPSEGGSTWHDIFNIQIPNDLLPYIAEPVYKSKNRNDKRIHDPGSTQWFKAIRSRKAAVDTKAKEQLRIDKLTEKARFWGTSTNSVDYREGLVDDLTNYQNHYHEHMNTSLRDNNIDTKHKNKNALLYWITLLDKNSHNNFNNNNKINIINK
ncbi:hypothetical protein RhiirC2_707381 [Rhizophagus irregularis]|uniref:DUF8211 domain-containing protein n=1 Tax=Rhizophagus irregularis TaxID=588596 RepID=A0A2N1NRG8_9GLOM|nr:hypothetical protein RhiirC2_707381 [Rhizophagus irregularis]